MLNATPPLAPASYTELPLGPLDAEKIEAVWRYDPADARQQRVLPDGRVDLVAHCAVRPGGGVTSVWPVIAGPADQPALVALRPGTVVMGLRFHIGWGGACLGIEPGALRNRTLTGVEVEQTLGPSLSPLLGADTLPVVESALRSVASALAARACVTAAHRRALEAIDRMKWRLAGQLPSPGCPTAPAAAAPASRTLRRDMVTVAGLPLRTLAGILRFQQAMVLLGAQGASLCDVALVSGYTDQAHMTRAFRRFGGFTPAVPQSVPLVRLDARSP
ncbi:MAG: helix-turn-helix domain-containing protein [Gammaproteobacteria bacterium]|nr:helix-turn-helix domain-containing protein [Gammaproteobacteria bacterium]MBU1507142.1 helix-turn-helix domain-containing protein [Gammaproteobacteria bacterium]MBU2121334.1 helix-turn-helix domain-containing protein [Gammaproteobacteria bacterium]MBU2171097.1 helix-turn-helix domain-containing protein [Gammaproteobacteria bacterium]MBU2201591.1 helix-turn-helix domain-containing protein [Gammaproteobacteria bacterium]